MASSKILVNSATRAGIVVGLAFAALRTAGGVTPPTADALQDWIAKSSVTLRSVNTADEDFNDLEPLRQAIGSARVVQLGEPSHGAGTGFEAKARLVKFLHARLGFDVLVWESGLYDVRLTEASLRAGEEPQKAAQRGIFSIWSASAEVQPLLDYVKVSQATTRPIEMAGFDLQFTSDECFDHFADDLHSFVRALPETNLRDDTSRSVDRAVAAYKAIRGRIETRRQKNAEAARAKLSEDERTAMLIAWEAQDAPAFRNDSQQLLQNADRLLAILRDDHAQFLQIRGTRQVEFMEHVIANMRSEGLDLYAVMGPDRPAGSPAFAPRLEVENRRDALNANNLRWLIQDVYAGRKIIVWAHNAHVMNAYYGSDWSTVYAAPHPDTMKPMGVFLKEWLKDSLYTVITTTYEGQDGWVGAPVPTAVPPAPDGSIEERIHRLGKPYVFLDLRSLRGSPKHPVHSVQQMRLPKYGTNTIRDLTQVGDGILYIDHMAPATALR